MRTQRINENLVTTSLVSTALTGFGVTVASVCVISMGINYFGNPNHASPTATIALFDTDSNRRPIYLAEANVYGAAGDPNRQFAPAHPTDSLLGDSVAQILTEPSRPLRARPSQTAAKSSNTNATRAVKTKPTVVRAQSSSVENVANTDIDNETLNKQKIITIEKPPKRPMIRVNGKEVPIGLPQLDALETSRQFSQLDSLPSEQPIIGVAQVNQQKIALHEQGRAFTPRSGVPKVSIIIGGLGLKSSLTTQAIRDLPADVSLAFIPHAHNLTYHINAARKDGHEVLVEMPMQPQDYGRFRPHPQVLAVSNSPQENITRLETILRKAPGIFGIMNYQGERFALDPNAVRPVTEALKRFNIAMVDDGSIPGSVLGSTSQQTGTAFTVADVQIDQRETSQDILLKLAELEAIARKNGHAVGSGYALPLTLDAVQKWAADLDRRGLQLVPISASLENAQPKKIN